MSSWDFRLGRVVVFVFKRENESKEAVEMERVATCTHCEGDGLLIASTISVGAALLPGIPGAAFLPERIYGSGRRR
eukprot:scaffold25669_cov69-Skeletonema_dohrnii-CCMP3373.AAC.4